MKTTILVAMLLSLNSSAEMLCELRISAAGEKIHERSLRLAPKATESGESVWRASVAGKLGSWTVEAFESELGWIEDAMTVRLIAPPNEKKEEDLNGDHGYFLRLQTRKSDIFVLERIYKKSPTVLKCERI